MSEDKLQQLQKENELLKKKIKAIENAKKLNYDLPSNYEPHSVYDVKPHKDPIKMDLVEYDIWRLKNIVVKYKRILSQEDFGDPRIQFIAFRRWLRKLLADYDILRVSAPQIAKKYAGLIPYIQEWNNGITSKRFGFDSKGNERFYKIIDAWDFTNPDAFKKVLPEEKKEKKEKKAEKK